jgi:DNA-binding NarL/FixJ family response regulator
MIWRDCRLFLKQGSGLACLPPVETTEALGKEVVVLSNYATADIRQRCAQLGVDAVFDKSNEIDALIDFCVSQKRRYCYRSPLIAIGLYVRFSHLPLSSMPDKGSASVRSINQFVLSA